MADGQIAEFPEIIDTYTDTWGKMVRYLEIEKYCANTDIIYTIRPDFETLQYEGGEVIEKAEDEVEPTKYGEAYHLEGVSTIVKEIYNQIKAIAGRLDNSLVFNPQKYYISIKAGKNIAFLKIRVKKVRFIAMLPEDEIRKSIRHHSVATLSVPVQEFYNGPCAAVDIKDSIHMDEIEILMHRMIEFNKSNNG